MSSVFTAVNLDSDYISSPDPQPTENHEDAHPTILMPLPAFNDVVLPQYVSYSFSTLPN